MLWGQCSRQRAAAHARAAKRAHAAPAAPRDLLPLLRPSLGASEHVDEAKMILRVRFELTPREGPHLEGGALDHSAIAACSHEWEDAKSREIE